MQNPPKDHEASFVLRGREYTPGYVDNYWAWESNVAADGSWLVTWKEGETTVRIWDLSVLPPALPTLPLALRGKWAVSPDKRWLLTWDEDPSHAGLRLWDLTDRIGDANPFALRGEVQSGSNFLFSLNGRWLVTQTMQLQDPMALRSKWTGSSDGSCSIGWP